jgi:hypothetical protein
MYSADILCAGAVQGHRANKLLAALEPEDFACLEPHLEIVRLQQGQVLCEAGQPLYDAYFPHNVIISLMAVMHDGRTAEMSAFGIEASPVSQEQRLPIRLSDTMSCNSPARPRGSRLPRCTR